MTDARTLTLSLGGKWLARYGTAACPICQPERRRDQDALTLSDAPDGRLLAHCKKAGCRFRDLAAALGLTSGIFAKPDPMETARREAKQRAEAAMMAAQAEAVWQEAGPICGTLAEAYLRGRGITEVVRLICTGSGRFLSGFPPWLRRHHFGHRLVEVGLIGSFPVK